MSNEQIGVIRAQACFICVLAIGMGVLGIFHPVYSMVQTLADAFMIAAAWGINMQLANLKRGEYYGKIFCEEGVVKERKFGTKGEASAYVEGFTDTIEVIDTEDDFYSAAVGTEPAEDEE
jgi:hypothetical protein